MFETIYIYCSHEESTYICMYLFINHIDKYIIRSWVWVDVPTGCGRPFTALHPGNILEPEGGREGYF